MTRTQWYFYVLHQHNKDDCVGLAQNHPTKHNSMKCVQSLVAFQARPLRGSRLLALAQTLFWRRQTNLLTCNQTRKGQHPAFMCQSISLHLHLFVCCISIRIAQNRSWLYPIISPALPMFSKEEKKGKKRLRSPPNELLPFTLEPCRRLTHHRGPYFLAANILEFEPLSCLLCNLTDTL